MPVKTYPKKSTMAVSEHFEAREFDCPCGHPECKETRISERLIELLGLLRNELACPIMVSHGGGCRCSKYEEELKQRGYHTAKKTSQHELGEAADVWTGHHTGAEIETAARKVGFKAVGVARSWAHVDTRDDKERSWSYR